MRREQPWSAAYRCDDIGIRISGDNGGDLAWLREFLEPWCEKSHEDSVDVRVRIIRSDELVRTLEAEWTRRQGTAAAIPPTRCIRLDTETVSFAGWLDAGVVRLVDPVTGCFFVVDGANVDIVTGWDDDRVRIAALGFVREAISGGIAATRPVVDLHAAAFAYGDRAVVVAGPKGSGKTSVLCHAILSGGAGLMANDRVLLQLHDATPMASGVPTVMSIRPGTTDMFSRLSSQADRFPALVSLERLARRADATIPRTPRAQDRTLLTPARFAGRLGAARVARAPLHAIVLPDVVGDALPWALEQLSSDVAAARVGACLYGVPAHRGEPTLFGALVPSYRTTHDPATLAPANDDTGAGERSVVRLVSSIPVYRCRLGRGAYDWPIAPLLHALGLDAN